MADKSIRIHIAMEGGKVVEAELVGIGNKGAAALGKVTAATAGVGGGMGRMGGAVQNASYQITDMIVQAEMGTDVFRIMGQQLPQLLAGFGVFGAVVGVAAAAMGPLIRMLTDGRDPVKALTEDLKALDQAMSGLRDADKAAGAGVGDLVEKYGSGAEQARKLLEIEQQRATLAAQMAYADASRGIADVFGGDATIADLAKTAAAMDAFREKAAQFSASFAQESEGNADWVLDYALRMQEAGIAVNENIGALAVYEQKLVNLKDAFGITIDAASELALQAAKVGEADTTAEQTAATIDLAQYIYRVTDGLTTASQKGLDLYKSLIEGGDAGLFIQQLNIAGTIGAGADEAARLASNMRYAAELARTGQASGPDSVRSRVQFEGGAFRALVLGAGLPTPKASSGGGGASDIEKTQKEIDRLNESLLAGASPAAKYRAELAKLDDMKLKGLSDGAYAAGVAKLNAELANASPWKKFTDAAIDAGAAGENMFEALVKTAKASMVNIVKEIVNAQLGRWLAQSLSGGGGGLGALLGGGGGGMGGILGGGGGGGLLGGLLGGTAASGAGLAGSGGITGMMASGMSGGAIGGLGAGLGALMGPLAIAAMLPSIIGGTKDTDSRYSGTVTTGGIDLEKLTDKHWSGFFGLLNNRWTERTAAESSITDPLRKAVVETQSSIMKMAERLEIGADTFDGFAYKIELSVKGLSESEALAKLQAELAGMGDAFASMITGIKSAQELSAVYEERLDIDRRIMQLQGDELGLQKMQLDQTHDLNKARLQEYFNMENSKKAMEKLNAELGRLSENDFKDRLSFDRARGDMVSGLRSVATASASQAPASAPSAVPLAASVANDLLSRIETNISMLVQMQKRWELDGLPTVAA